MSHPIPNQFFTSLFALQVWFPNLGIQFSVWLAVVSVYPASQTSGFACFLVVWRGKGESILCCENFSCSSVCRKRCCSSCSPFLEIWKASCINALAMLCLASGCFFASTSFLPSSFSMYAMSLSSTLFLFYKPAMAVSVAATGVILGWPFSILAFLPLTIYSLIKSFKPVFLTGVVSCHFYHPYGSLIYC